MDGAAQDRHAGGMKQLPRAAWVAIGLVVLVAAGALLVGPPPDKGPSTSAEAPIDSSAETLQVDDPVHNRPFDVSLWSPSPENQRSELVVISHGFSGSRQSHTGLAESLAAAGYTVAAPTHPDLAGLESGDSRLDPLTLRPRHLSLTIDEIEKINDGSFDSVTVAGHSLGGYSALRLAGAQPMLDGTLRAHCQVVDDPVICTDQAIARFETLVETGADFTDTRVNDIVLLAPGYGPLFGKSEIALTAEVLVIEAADDEELPGGQVEDFVRRVSSDIVTDSVSGGHFVFLGPCTDEVAATWPSICEDPEGVNRTAVHDELKAAILDQLQS